MHFRRMIFVFFILCTSLALLSLVQAQQPDPLPLPLESANTQNRATVELLTNTSFETDADADKIPDDWVGQQTSIPRRDKLTCNTNGSTVSNTGECAFQFKANIVPDVLGFRSKITQKHPDLDLAGVEAVTFSAYVKPQSGVPKHEIGRAKIRFSDGSRQRIKLKLPATSTGGYVQLTKTKTLDLAQDVAIVKVKVDFRYRATTGKYRVDDASFTYTVADTGPTTTATATPSDTPTDGPSPIPSDTPTITSSPTASNTPTITPSSTASNTPTITPSSTPSNTPGPD